MTHKRLLIMAAGTGGHISRDWRLPTPCARAAGALPGLAPRMAWSAIWYRATG